MHFAPNTPNSATREKKKDKRQNLPLHSTAKKGSNYSITKCKVYKWRRKIIGFPTLKSLHIGRITRNPPSPVTSDYKLIERSPQTGWLEPVN